MHWVGMYLTLTHSPTRPLAILGFVICSVGVCFGTAAIVVGQVIVLTDPSRTGRRKVIRYQCPKASLHFRFEATSR
jgi:hypothetical protein